MGFRRWCTVESKHFVMDFEGAASGLRIQESSRGVTRSIFLNYKDSSWLLESVEELLSAKSSDVFWRRSRSGLPGILAQRCANKHGRYLIVEVFGAGRRRGFILVPEGRKRVGWNSFHSELFSVVKHMKDHRNADIPPTRPPMKKTHASRSSETSRKIEFPESSHRRSFAETLMSTTNMAKPLTLLTRTATKQSKLPELNSVLVKEKLRPSDVALPNTPKSVAPISVTVNHAKRPLESPCQKLCLRERIKADGVNQTSDG